MAPVKVLVTGGARYIGSTICSALEDAGHTPIVLDTLVNGYERFARGRPFYKGDIADDETVGRIFDDHDEGATPYQRMLRSGVLVGARQVVMERLYLSLNPLLLSRQIEAETEKLLRLAWRQGDPLSWSPLR